MISSSFFWGSVSSPPTHTLSVYYGATGTQAATGALRRGTELTVRAAVGASAAASANQTAEPRRPQREKPPRSSSVSGEQQRRPRDSGGQGRVESHRQCCLGKVHDALSLALFPTARIREDAGPEDVGDGAGTLGAQSPRPAPVNLEPNRRSADRRPERSNRNRVLRRPVGIPGLSDAGVAEAATRAAARRPPDRRGRRGDARCRDGVADLTHNGRHPPWSC